MRKKNFSRSSSTSRSRKGILFGIPVLLFITGILLISIAGWNYLRQAYFISRLFIENNYKPVTTEKINFEHKDGKVIQFPSLGEEFGELIIETANIDYPVIQGDRDEDLRKGIGHFDGSRYPGENGNVVLAGHRETVFKNLGSVKLGDKIKFNTTYENYVYKVVDIKIVGEKDKTIVTPTDSEKLTIYTCYPFNTIGYTPQRYIVIGELEQGTPLKELLKERGK